MTERFPELETLVEFIPDGYVLDGEIVAWNGEQPLNFNILQKRIGRKKLKISHGLLLLSLLPMIFWKLKEWILNKIWNYGDQNWQNS